MVTGPSPPVPNFATSNSTRKEQAVSALNTGDVKVALLEVKLAYPPAAVVNVTLFCDHPAGSDPSIKGSSIN